MRPRFSTHFRLAVELTFPRRPSSLSSRKFFKCRRKTGCNFFLWQDEHERLDIRRLVDGAVNAHEHEGDPHDHAEHLQLSSSSLARSSSVDATAVEQATVAEGKKRARSEDDDDEVKPPQSVKKVRFHLGPPKFEHANVEDDKLKAVAASKTVACDGVDEETIEDSEVEDGDLSLTLDDLQCVLSAFPSAFPH